MVTSPVECSEFYEIIDIFQLLMLMFLDSKLMSCRFIYLIVLDIYVSVSNIIDSGESNK